MARRPFGYPITWTPCPSRSLSPLPCILRLHLFPSVRRMLCIWKGGRGGVHAVVGKNNGLSDTTCPNSIFSSRTPENRRKTTFLFSSFFAPLLHTATHFGLCSHSFLLRRMVDT